MNFETEYQLKEFRDEQHEYFDKDGKAFPFLKFCSFAERMLKLINSLESELVHSSDCAVHNEPEKPNGLCDCHLSQKFSPEVKDRILKEVILPIYKNDVGDSTADGTEWQLVEEIENIVCRK